MGLGQAGAGCRRSGLRRGLAPEMPRLGPVAYHAPMQQRNVARELGLVVASIAVLVHWLDPTPAVLVTVLIALAAAAATAPLVGEWLPWRMPLIPMVLPALAAFSIAGIARVVSPVPWLALDFLVGWALVAWSFNLETTPDVLLAIVNPASSPDGTEAAVMATAPAVRLRPRPRAEFGLAQIVAEPVVVSTPELAPHPRPLAVRFTALGLAFLGFVAAGGLVPGGLVLVREPLSTRHLVEFVALDALIAGAVGYRLASLTSPYRSDRIVRIVAIGQYAVAVAVSAALLRTLGLPRLFVPALLMLVGYLVMAIRESQDPLRENYPLLQELAMLGAAALAVIVWGMLAR
jgi:hypothetical protein